MAQKRRNETNLLRFRYEMTMKNCFAAKQGWPRAHGLPPFLRDFLLQEEKNM
jgi:hypothetical protein